MMCNGKNCKHENWKLIKHPAIEGLNSNFITNTIIASQRLSERLINEFNIIEQLKEKNVKLIVNLEEPGEHANCGDGVLQNTGFSYDPELIYRGTKRHSSQSWYHVCQLPLGRYDSHLC